MASNAVINIQVNGQQATQTMGAINNSVNTTIKSTTNLKTQLRAMTLEMQGLDPASAKFKQLAIEAGKLKDTIRDTAAVINATAGSPMENMATGLTKIGGIGINAFQGIAGMQALLGDNSEELAKTMAKLQGAMAVGEALKGLGGLSDTFTEIKASLGAAAAGYANLTIVQKGNEIATNSGTIATKALGMSMKALPIVAIIAGIAAIAGALYAYSKSNKEAEEAEKKRLATLKAQDEAQKKFSGNLAKEVVGVKILAEQVKNSEPGSKRRVELIKEMNEKYGTHLTNIKDEAKFTKDVNDEVRDYIELAEKRIRATLAEETATKYISRENELRAKSNKLKKEAGDIDAFATKNAEGLYEIHKKDRDISIAQYAGDPGKQQRIIDEKNAKLKKIEQMNEANRLAKMADDAAKYADNALKNAAKYAEQTEETDDVVTESKNNEIKVNKELEESLNDLMATEFERTHNEEENALKRKEEKDAELKRLFELSTDDLNKQKQFDDAKAINERLYQAEIKKIRDKAEKENNERIANEVQFYLDKIQEKIDKEAEIEKEAFDKNKETADAKWQEQLDSFKDMSNKASDAIGNIFEGVFTGENINESFDALRESISGVTKEMFQTFIAEFSTLDLEKKVELIGEALQKVSQMTVNAISAMFDARAEKEAEARNAYYTAETETLNAQLKNRMLTEEEYDSEIRRLESRRKEEEKQAKQKAFKQNKALAIANAVMNTATAVMGAAPVIPLMIAMGVLGAAQVGIIASQQFKAARGGIVPGNAPSHIDSVNALLAPGETVINSRSSAMYPELLSTINEAGGGVPLVPKTVSTQMSGTNSNGNNNQSISVEVNANVIESSMTNVQGRVERLRRSKNIF